MISLEKYHGRHLGAMERDLDSFNHQAGLPVEVVEAFHLLDRDPVPEGLLYPEILDFVASIPEGLIPRYFARKLCACRNDTTRKMIILQLPLENFCALRMMAIWATRNATKVDLSKLLKALTTTDSLEEPLSRIFSNPHRFFSK